MAIEIRDLRDGELRAFLDTVERAFGESITDARYEAHARIFEPDRVLVAADHDRIVGGGAAFTFRLTVPGGEVPAAGVTAVGVLPSHRRRGMLTSLMRRQFEDVRRRGEPVAILWASEGGIYQRFGYGLATLHASVEVPTAQSSFRLPHRTEGDLRFLTRDEAAARLPPFYESMRARTPGFLDRSRDWWDVEILADPEWGRAGAGPKSIFLYEVGGTPEGYVIYRIRSEWDAGVTRSTLEVIELMTTTQRAFADVWRFCLDHDLITTVKARVQPADHPLLLLLAEPRRPRLALGDGLWLRIVDVAGALEARSYRAADRLVIDLSDPFVPELAGRWSIDTTGDAARIGRTEEPPDLVLDTTDLAALYLSTFTASQLIDAGRGRELSAGAVARADALFAWHPRPWCPQLF
jgi:predicted acetyltransferase